MSRFAIGESDFLLDGAPLRILSGAIHYFRVPPDLWQDRIVKARAMGLNTIETYVAWNAHEPRRGEWDATDGNDLGRFLDLIADAGMHAIVRPGPYICAEWHNGGLPVWLTSIPNIGLRRTEPQYMAEVTAYLERVYEIVAPRQIDRGGPVILVQIENEYGAYGSDKAYLRELVALTTAAGITVPLTTVDQPHPWMLQNGSIPGVHITGSFGSRAADRLATLREHQPTGPLMCSEFWDGWFDWWGAHHHTTPVEEAAQELDTMLAAGASVNFYMFHGGTNFGLTNGANDKGSYLPIVTSYDYDAPLDEAGNVTAKYVAFRDVIAKYAAVPDAVPERAAPAPAFEVRLQDAGDWLGDAPSERAIAHDVPPTFEQLEHLSAVVVYEAPLDPAHFAGGAAAVFEVDEVRDQAWVQVDGVAVGSMSRTRHERRIVIPPGQRLSIRVEEQGRVNYASRIGEHKGLIGTPRLGGVPLTEWTARPVDVLAVGRAIAQALPGDGASGDGASGDGPIAGPVAVRGTFTLDDAADLFLDTTSWGKGFAFVNGFLLGRYGQVGPQKTLYVPAPAVHAGQNTVVALELESIGRAVASFVPDPALGDSDE